MAKNKSNKDQRRAKALKAKKSTKIQQAKSKPRQYQGYMKMFLDGDKVEDLIKRMVRTEDFLTQPHDIFSYDRTYTFTINAISKDGQRAHAKAEIEGEHDQSGLVAAIGQAFRDFCDELMEEAPEVELDYRECHVVIRALKTKIKAPGGYRWV